MFSELLVRLPSYDLADAARDFIRICLEDETVQLTRSVQQNVSLFTDQLRTTGEKELVCQINELMIQLAEECGDLVVHGHVLLESFDSQIDRNQPEQAYAHLVEAIGILYEAAYSEQLVILPRLQTMLELVQNPEEGFRVMGSIENALEGHLHRIVDNAPNSLEPEVLDTQLYMISSKLNREVGVSSAKLGELEVQLYGLASRLQGQPTLMDYYGETLVLLGDVFDYEGKEKGALDSYLNAISFFEQCPIDERNDRLTEVLADTRDKAIYLMRRLNLPEYRDQLNDNLRRRHF
jgi:hypothetical protein